MARSFSRTYRYVAREFIFSFAVSFLFFFFIFFVNQILVLAEEIFSKKVPIWDVLQLIVYSLPWVTAFSFPFGSLLGALMAVGRLSTDNEVLAFSALGIPRRKLLAPLLVLGLLFSLVSFIMNDYFMPLSNIRFAEIYRRILYSNPAVELEPRSIKKLEQATIITGEVEGRRIKDILIIDRSPEQARRIFMAQEAYLEESAEEAGVVSLTLENVFSHVSYPQEGDRYDYTRSESLVYTILLSDFTPSIGGLNPSFQSSVDVWKEIVKKSAVQDVVVRQHDEQVAILGFALASQLADARLVSGEDAALIGGQRAAVQARAGELAAEKSRNIADQSLRSYLIEFYRKFSVPAACLVFAFFAFPVGMRARRSGRTVGFGVGLFVSIVYWGLLTAGTTLGVRMSFSPALSMLLPDVMVLLGGLILLAVRPQR